jgi:hypothetical protein
MPSYCGIDVSKDRLDVAVLPQGPCWSVANDAGGDDHRRVDGASQPDPEL